MRIDKELNSLAIEAKAQIVWGKSPDKIRSWLSGQGVSDIDIEKIVSDSMRERGLEFRKRGIKEIILGTPIIAVIGAVILVLHSVDLYRIRPRFLTILLCIGAYGIYKTSKGLYWVLLGSKSGGSLTEL